MGGAGIVQADMNEPDLALLAELERKILWLATWTIHNANHLRASRTG